LGNTYEIREKSLPVQKREHCYEIKYTGERWKQRSRTVNELEEHCQCSFLNQRKGRGDAKTRGLCTHPVILERHQRDMVGVTGTVPEEEGLGRGALGVNLKK